MIWNSNWVSIKFLLYLCSLFMLLRGFIKVLQWCFHSKWMFISVSLGCGSSNSENNSYIMQSSSTSISNPCKHTICPCSNNVCRIRYDFNVSIILLNNYLKSKKAFACISIQSNDIFIDIWYPVIDFALILDICYNWSPNSYTSYFKS